MKYMWNSITAIFVINALLNAYQSIAESCYASKFVKTEGMELPNQVIKTVEKSFVQLCWDECYVLPWCLSINARIVWGFLFECDLNDANTTNTALVPRPGSDYYEVKEPDEAVCKLYCCKRNGEWSPWTSWTHGVRGDGQPNIQNRNRTCISPPPWKNVCDGASTETKPCTPLVKVNLTGCASPLGMEDGSIPDSQITQSSLYKNDEKFHGRNSRLNKVSTPSAIGGWAAGGQKIGEFLQVDLGGPKTITMVASQGRQNVDQWVTQYSLSYSDDGSKWTDYDLGSTKIFPANADQNTIVTHKLIGPIKARHIRVIVKSFKIWPAIRVEFYGCPQ